MQANIHIHTNAGTDKNRYIRVLADRDLPHLPNESYVDPFV